VASLKKQEGEHSEMGQQSRPAHPLGRGAPGPREGRGCGRTERRGRGPHDQTGGGKSHPRRTPRRGDSGESSRVHRLGGPTSVAIRGENPDSQSSNPIKPLAPSAGAASTAERTRERFLFAPSINSARPSRRNPAKLFHRHRSRLRNPRL